MVRILRLFSNLGLRVEIYGKFARYSCKASTKPCQDLPRPVNTYAGTVWWAASIAQGNWILGFKIWIKLRHLVEPIDENFLHRSHELFIPGLWWNKKHNGLQSNLYNRQEVFVIQTYWENKLPSPILLATHHCNYGYQTGLRGYSRQNLVVLQGPLLQDLVHHLSCLPRCYTDPGKVFEMTITHCEASIMIGRASCLLKSLGLPIPKDWIFPRTRHLKVFLGRWIIVRYVKRLRDVSSPG